MLDRTQGLDVLNVKKPRQLSRYINSKGEYAPYEYGKCNRQEKCGYHLKIGKNVINDLGNGINTLAPVIIHKEELQAYINWNDYNFEFDDEYDLIEYIMS